MDIWLLGSGYQENTAMIIHVHVFGWNFGLRLSLSLALVDNTIQLTKVVALVYGCTRNESLSSLTSLPVLWDSNSLILVLVVGL